MQIGFKEDGEGEYCRALADFEGAGLYIEL